MLENDANIFDDAWLDIGDTSLIKTTDILRPREEDVDNWGLSYFRIMTDPEYLGYAAKVLLNVDLLPIQCVILQEMWTHPFPMYIASRGFGKAIPVDWVVQTPNGWMRMGDIKIGDTIYTRNGSTTKVIGVYQQGQKEIYRVKLLDGRFIDCCEDHLWTVRYQGKEKIFSTKELYNRKIKINSKRSSSVSYLYSIPNCEPIQHEEKGLPLDPYILGCLLGDGSMRGHTPRISTNDQFIVDKFREVLFDFKIERDVSTNNYTIVSKNKCYIHGVNKFGTEYITKKGNPLTQTIKKMRLNVNCKDKFIPNEYKYGSVEQRLEIVRGLMDTDGSINDQGAIEFTNTCEQLVDDLIEVLRSLGITCKKSIDNRGGQEHILPQGTLAIRKPYFRVFINTSKPIFKLPRKLERVKKQSTIREKYVSIVEIEKTNKFTEMQCISVDSPDNTYIIKDYIVTHNSFLMAVYCMLKMVLTPKAKGGGAGVKIVIVGAAWRQARVIFEYMETIWKNSPRLRSLCTNTRQGPKRDIDRCTMYIGDNWAIAIPLGNGDKIRGLRATIVIADEFSSISPDVYETVIQGFASVTANPVSNTKLEYKIRAMRDAGIDYVPNPEDASMGNQIILSGTAGYDFEHFADYWKKYKTIINSGGDTHKLEEIYPEGVPVDFNWKDFCIIRIPCDIVPKGFMDQKILDRARATTHTGLFQMEYGAVFTKDSSGFFKRSLIHKCVANDDNTSEITWPSWCTIPFDAAVRGNLDKKYIFGIDPASEVDNFSIVVLEMYENHSRIVYCWTTNRKEHGRRKKAGFTEETDFYAYCATKIRQLMKVFPCERIGLDAQGGGIAIMEALHNKNNLKGGDIPIWPIIDDDKPSDTDNEPGLHILELVQFARYEWISEANHGLRKDMEDRVLLFPRFDPISLELAAVQDNQRLVEFEKNNPGKKLEILDTLEDCVLEIEELKNELTTIVITKTGTGVNSRDRWDTPEVKVEGGKKGRLRKDRYSSLLIANMLARQTRKERTAFSYDSVGGYIQDIKDDKNGEIYLNAPEWMKNTFDDFYRHI